MNLALPLRAALIAIVLSALPGLAHAQEGPRPAQVADQCIDKMQRVAARTSDDIRDNARETSAQLRWFDRNGAEDATLENAAERGKRQNARRADAGRDEINETVRRCVARLEAMGAPDQLIERVRTAGERSRERVRAALADGNASINQTLRRALND